MIRKLLIASAAVAALASPPPALAAPSAHDTAHTIATGQRWTVTRRYGVAPMVTGLTLSTCGRSARGTMPRGRLVTSPHGRLWQPCPPQQPSGQARRVRAAD